MKRILLLLLFFASSQALAHPVSYEGSFGFMVQNGENLSHTQFNHSFKYWWALGAHNFQDVQNDRSANIASTNFLLKRWNSAKFQSNIYANLGWGQSDFTGEPEDVGYGLLQFDIEDRRLYFLAKGLQFGTEDLPHFRKSIVRFGFAPYPGGFTELNSWILLEWSKLQFLENPAFEDLTPMVRLFYKNILVEFGQSLNGQTKFNLISHF